MANQDKYTLQRTGVSEQIFEILKAEIVSGKWEPGMRFLSENELASRFGVSRMSARNALQRLCALDLLETKQGGGSFVKAFSLADYFEKASGLIAGKQTMDEIRQFRFYFERDCMELACRKRSDADVDELRAIFHRMAECAEDGDADGFFEADMEFHFRITEMTGNQIFVMVNTLLRDLLMAQLKDNTRYYAEIKNASMVPRDENYVLKVLLADHQNYITALEQCDYTLATENLKTYLTEYINK